MKPAFEAGGFRGAPAEHYERLKERIALMRRAVVAFSGGVDSSLLLAAAFDALCDRVVAVTAVSPTFPDCEKEQAVAIAKHIGARHVLIESREMDDPVFRSNPPDRCYYCKRDLFSALFGLASFEGVEFVLDGNNHDDRFDVRPGGRAALEAGVRSPLAELGIGKDLARAMARERGLPNWDQPACACLASRIPYGTEITPERLAMIGAAEKSIREAGFRVVRVRSHGELARVEVAPEEIGSALAPRTRARIVDACKRHGFLYACLDLEGYRTGSLNEALDGVDRSEG